jgi:hypothetical protein
VIAEDLPTATCEVDPPGPTFWTVNDELVTADLPRWCDGQMPVRQRAPATAGFHDDCHDPGDLPR